MKTYPIPQEVEILMVEYHAMNNLRDAYVKLPFGFKKAVRASIGAEKARLGFWEKVADLYPETMEKRMSYSTGSREIRVLGADQS